MAAEFAMRFSSCRATVPAIDGVSTIAKPVRSWEGVQRLRPTAGVHVSRGPFPSRFRLRAAQRSLPLSDSDPHGTCCQLEEERSSLLSGGLRESFATHARASSIPSASSSHRVPLYRVRAHSNSGSVTSVETSKSAQAESGSETAAGEEQVSANESKPAERGEEGREKNGEAEEKAESKVQAEGGEREDKEAEEEEEDDPEVEEGFKMSRVCDRLVDVFWVEKPEPAQWRLLLAFSSEWARIRPHFFTRVKLRAQGFEEQEKPDKAAELYRLARRLNEVDDSMAAHNELFVLVEEHEAEGALEGLVARRRKDFTGEFFEHLQILCQAAHGDPQRQDEIASLAAKCVTAVDIHDKVESDEAEVEVAQAKFDDIMGSGSLAEACSKIDQLAARQQLDSTLMLMITKAWAAAKESNMMKDEVKDIMYHLYKQAQINMRMLVPKEVRILRHVLAVEDPRQQLTELTNAFSPGGELEVQNASEDMLYTTPEKLLEVIQQVLEAYYAQRRQQSSLIDEAKKLMNPAVIARMEVLKDVIVDQFM